MKFKVGDSVIVIKEPEIMYDENPYKLGKIFTIREIFTYPDNHQYLVSDKVEVGRFGVFDHQVDYSPIFNTPLYNAMKEEE